MRNRHLLTGLSKRKKISILVLILLVVGAGLWLLHPWQKSAIEVAREKGNVSGQLDRENARNEKKSSDTSSGGSIDSPGDNLKPVTPVLSRWDASADPVEVAGYVQGVLEDGGTCSYVFSKDAISFTKTSAGFQDVSHTTCTPIDVSRSSFPQAGSWSVVLKYKSSTSSGASNAQNFTIK